MKMVVIGGGSVGMLLAARLTLGGGNVKLITRGEGQALQLSKKGLTLHMIDGTRRTVSIEASAYHHPLPAADFYLLAVKQPDIASVLPSLRTISPQGKVVALQNGIGHHERLAEALHGDQLFFAVNTEGARRLSETEVEHTGHGCLRIGPWQKQRQTDQLLADFIRFANASGVPAEYAEETCSLIWRKVIVNGVVNPLTALFEVANGRLLDSPVTISTMRRLFAEAAAVANAAGQKIDETDWQELVTICRNTSRNHSSMLQDFWHGRPTEIEAINGYLVKKGKELGVSTPWNETVRKTVLLKTSLRLLKGEACDERSG
jgi:2-dehydropantoate 2-reductase